MSHFDWVGITFLALVITELTPTSESFGNKQNMMSNLDGAGEQVPEQRF